jgi:H+/Cl- antiporter ClcA
LELHDLLINAELIPWPWWILIGLAVGYFLLLVWSWLASAKQADEKIIEEALELQPWYQRNGHR